MTTESPDHALFAAFRRVDADDDGKLDLVGFTMILEELGLTWARHETQDRFEKADHNRDGLISFPELKDLLETHGWKLP